MDTHHVHHRDQQQGARAIPGSTFQLTLPLHPWSAWVYLPLLAQTPAWQGKPGSWLGVWVEGQEGNPWPASSPQEQMESLEHCLQWVVTSGQMKDMWPWSLGLTGGVADAGDKHAATGVMWWAFPVHWWWVPFPEQSQHWSVSLGSPLWHCGVWYCFSHQREKTRVRLYTWHWFHCTLSWPNVEFVMGQRDWHLNCSFNTCLALNGSKVKLTRLPMLCCVLWDTFSQVSETSPALSWSHTGQGPAPYHPVLLQSWDDWVTGHGKRPVQARALLDEMFYSSTHDYLGYIKIFSLTSWGNSLYLTVTASSLNSKPRSC